jgi:hypothetical protein
MSRFPAILKGIAGLVVRSHPVTTHRQKPRNPLFSACLCLFTLLAVLLRIHAPTGWRRHTLRASLARRKWLLGITDWRIAAHVSVHFNGQSLERNLSGNTSVKGSNNWTRRGTVKICVSKVAGGRCTYRAEHCRFYQYVKGRTWCLHYHFLSQQHTHAQRNTHVRSVYK